MQIGLVGLGKMGNNMRSRLRDHDIEVIGYDNNPAISDVKSLADLVKALPAPRIVWVMVPAGEITAGVVKELSTELEPGDMIIDGGNSKWTSDFENSKLLEEKQIKFHTQRFGSLLVHRRRSRMRDRETNQSGEKALAS